MQDWQQQPQPQPQQYKPPPMMLPPPMPPWANYQTYEPQAMMMMPPQHHAVPPQQPQQQSNVRVPNLITLNVDFGVHDVEPVDDVRGSSSGSVCYRLTQAQFRRGDLPLRGLYTMHGRLEVTTDRPCEVTLIKGTEDNIRRYCIENRRGAFVVPLINTPYTEIVAQTRTTSTSDAYHTASLVYPSGAGSASQPMTQGGMVQSQQVKRAPAVQCDVTQGELLWLFMDVLQQQQHDSSVESPPLAYGIQCSQHMVSVSKKTRAATSAGDKKRQQQLRQKRRKRGGLAAVLAAAAAAGSGGVVKKRVPVRHVKKLLAQAKKKKKGKKPSNNNGSSGGGSSGKKKKKQKKHHRGHRKQQSHDYDD